MTHPRPTTPVGDGELLAQPPVEAWADLTRANAAAAAEWDFPLAGMPVRDLRDLARREAIAAGRAFCDRLGIPVAEAPDAPALIVMTGHQPELYHAGVWAKDFLLQWVADQTGAAAVDIVVDTDTFDELTVAVPCMREKVQVCPVTLATGGPDVPYLAVPPPGAEQVALLRGSVTSRLETLPARSVLRHFESFADGLADAAGRAGDLAETITLARRLHEAPAGTRYLELPVSVQSAGAAFRLFVAAIVLEAGRFAEAHNTELAEYRERTGARSAARPVPDLEIAADRVEVPFWAIVDGRRRPLHAVSGPIVRLECDGNALAESESDPEALASALEAAGALVAPRALTLTLFERLLVADLFIHGVGGGRYDRVTDGIARRFLGVGLPPFVVASLTAYLPLGAPAVADADIEEAVQRLNRLEQNPDQLLDEIEFDSVDEAERAAALAAEKSALVASIAGTGADKKEIGRRIREVNAALAGLLSPVRAALESRLAQLRAAKEAADVLADRTYPLCLWSATEVAEKVR